MNSYKDTPEIDLRLQNPLMKRIVELRENGFACENADECAPLDFDDAMDSYRRILELTGQIAADTIAPNAGAIDREGSHCAGGRVAWAEGIQRNMTVMRQAGLSGISLPRQYGGLNLPFTVFCAISEMVSRSDASFQNVWGLQSCADTINEFGSGEQKEKYLRMVCQGASMSMDLTEPDAGSDLQSAMLRATEDVENGCWRLNGVKRFITNGDSDIHLVLARSEEGTRDGRGLSLFIYDKRDGGVDVRRIEDKMGIHGSPTCELVFRNARAELCGVRRMGLIKYVMSLMNGARLGIATQSVGISDAAWREAVQYAADRCQFGHSIAEFPAVYQMLALMKARVEASRSLLYETARYVDIYKALDAVSRQRPLTPEERAEGKRYSRLADALTPLVKGISSEFANQNAYDCIQVHGGSGFMRDYTCERLYRDARITSIYEGTTQLQVVAALRHITGGTYSQLTSELLDSLASGNAYASQAGELDSTRERLQRMRGLLDQAVASVAEAKQPELTDFCGRRLMEMAAYTIMATLLARDAAEEQMASFSTSSNALSGAFSGESTGVSSLLRKPQRVFLDWAEAQVVGHHAYIIGLDKEKGISCYK